MRSHADYLCCQAFKLIVGDWLPGTTLKYLSETAPSEGSSLMKASSLSKQKQDLGPLIRKYLLYENWDRF